MDNETKADEPYPTYKFEIYESQSSTDNRLIGTMLIQAETYEKAVNEVSKNLNVRCVAEIN